MQQMLLRWGVIGVIENQYEIKTPESFFLPFQHGFVARRIQHVDV